MIIREEHDRFRLQPPHLTTIRGTDRCLPGSEKIYRLLEKQTGSYLLPNMMIKFWSQMFMSKFGTFRGGGYAKPAIWPLADTERYSKPIGSVEKT